MLARAITSSLGRSRLSNLALDFVKGSIARNPALAMSHLSSAREVGERSKSATRIATKPNPQMTLKATSRAYVTTREWVEAGAAPATGLAAIEAPASFRLG